MAIRSGAEGGTSRAWPNRRQRGLLGLLEAAVDDRQNLTLAAVPEDGVRWALETGLGPLLVRAVADDRDAPRSPVWPALYGADLAARVLAAEQADALTALADACAGAVAPLVLLKGIAMAHYHYPRPHLRPMRDLDVLVDAAAVPTVESTLRELGYRPHSKNPPEYYLTHHHGMPFVHPRTGIWVEVHHALFPPASPFARDAVFGRHHIEAELRPCELHGRPVSRFSDELQLLHTAAHWARELRVAGGTVGMLDLIYLVARAPERLRWDDIIRWLDGAAAAAPVYLLLSYLHRRELVSIPREVLHALRARQHALGAMNLAILHALVDRYVVGGRPLGWLVSPRNFEIAWKTLLGPGPPSRSLLRLPWSLWPARWRPVPLRPRNPSA